MVKNTVKEEGDLFTGKLVLAKNRGGLCEPKNVMISFFALCESIFRSIFASSENDTAELHGRFATEMMLYRCFMHACTYVHDVNVKSQEAVLMHILGLFDLDGMQVQTVCRKVSM